MKTIKAFLLLPLLTFLMSLTLSGCYTQLAFVDDNQYSAVEPPPIIIYQPLPVYLPVPYDPPPPPVFNPLPPAGSSPTMTVPSSSSQIRDKGYHRTDQSGSTQSTTSTSDNRTSGSTRGGR
jgi:hypothetical protein